MFSINDTIMYGSQSVCKITDITEMNFTGNKKIKYYVLEPVYEKKSTIFVPVRNEKLIEKMQKVLSADEIYQIINTIPNENVTDIGDQNKRKEVFNEIVDSGDRLELMKLVKTLYKCEQERKANGKKLCASDEHIMKSAEKILYDEFALVLNIKRDQILSFIMEKIEVKEKQSQQS